MLTAALVSRRELASRVLGTEAYKTLLQFLLVAVLGGGTSLLYQALNRQADERNQRARRDEDRSIVLREARQRWLRDTIEQYQSVKRARRLLRAQALAPGSRRAGPRVKVGRYDELLQVVLDAQLWLEGMVAMMRADSTLFPENPDVTAAVVSAEEYLRTLVTEYEGFLPSTQARQEDDLEKLPVLSEFIGPYELSQGFRHQFTRPMQRVIAELQALSLG
ncbi:hypothetical protein [Plantactinospora sp. KBS50]|uniref:hypothetical protein n=1 Tax=Plantactinospora sp. KBS50 TaxID=2024580 RepID=UPI000BAADFAD|nr:hypothetical protein [Plantactinospora sp. KBS50]ASW53136.1 hypothetical protein CIK06_01460 [Plantactinospora sp. KBS50]